MRKCKYCGKEFKSTPVYCVCCGASDDFLVRKTDKVISKYSEESKIEIYDELIKEFLGDEYIENDKWTIPRYELNQIKKELDDTYYSFFKKKLFKKRIIDEPLNSRSKYGYYNDLEDVLEDSLYSTEETTFNGIFDKEDTIESTFLNGKKDNQNVLDDEIIVRTKKNKKNNKKLWKMFFGLSTLFTLLLVIMFTLINNIVNVNDIEAPLPTEAVAFSLFSEIKNKSEVSFMKNPQCLYISSDMDIMNSDNQAYLKVLFELVNSKDYEIKRVKKIEAKGALRAVVTYEVTGESLSAKVFESLIFRNIGNSKFKLDFEEFILRYNRFKNTSKANYI